MTGGGSQPVVRELTVDDIPSCLALCVDRGWKAEEGKWRLLFEVGVGLGIDDPDGGLAASVVLTSYHGDLAWVGMMLVASRRGYQGLGRRIMQDLIERAAGRRVCLCATEAGMPLYVGLGFEPIETVVTHRGNFQPLHTATAPTMNPPMIRVRADADFAAMAEIDSAAFGADRGSVLRAVPASGGVAIVADDPQGGGLTGHAMAWDNNDTLTIGPLVARDDETARALAEALTRGAEGRRVRIDLFARSADLSLWAEERGILPVRHVPMMSLGGREIAGKRHRLYAITLQALG